MELERVGCRAQRFPWWWMKYTSILQITAKYLLLKTSGGEGLDIHTMTVWLRQYCVGVPCRSWWLPGTLASWCLSSPRSWFIWWRKNSTRTLPPMPMPCGGERWVRSLFLYKMEDKVIWLLEVYFVVNKTLYTRLSNKALRQDMTGLGWKHWRLNRRFKRMGTNFYRKGLQKS